MWLYWLATKSQQWLNRTVFEMRSTLSSQFMDIVNDLIQGISTWAAEKTIYFLSKLLHFSSITHLNVSMLWYIVHLFVTSSLSWKDHFRLRIPLKLQINPIRFLPSDSSSHHHHVSSSLWNSWTSGKLNEMIQSIWNRNLVEFDCWHVLLLDFHFFIIFLQDISKMNLSALSEDERNHILFHEKHRGHEGMHAMMLLVLIISTFVVQICLITWKKRHMKSYQNVSMFGMWIIPLVISVHNSWYRFVGIWLIITILTVAFIWKPLTNHRMCGSIPRLIYQWFYYLYSFSSGVAITGYVIVLCTFLGELNFWSWSFTQ